MSDQYKYDLISFKLCPFVQRSVITLEEKGAPYTLEYIDLANKPDWFLAISPLGKVPVLRVGGDTVVFESAVINEFIEETAPGPALHPSDPLKRAHNRAWIEAASELLRRTFRMLAADSEEKALKGATNVRALLARFDWELTGPLFNGERFSLVDAATAPVLQRLSWCNEAVPALDLFCGSDLDKVRTWRDALIERDSVRRSTVGEIHELFLESLREKAKHGGWVGAQVLSCRR
jgi:glutathione S-transferase